MSVFCLLLCQQHYHNFNSYVNISSVLSWMTELTNAQNVQHDRHYKHQPLYVHVFFFFFFVSYPQVNGIVILLLFNGTDNGIWGINSTRKAAAIDTVVRCFHLEESYGTRKNANGEQRSNKKMTARPRMSCCCCCAHYKYSGLYAAPLWVLK